MVIAKINGKTVVLLFTLSLFSLALMACGGGDNDDGSPEAYARFNNDLSCQDSGAFTATLTLGDATMSSSSTNWSTCTTQSTGSVAWSLSVSAPCLAWDANGTIDLAAGTIYDFVLTLDNTTAALISFSKEGHCPSTTSSIVGKTAIQVFDDPDNDYERMIEIPLEIDIDGVQRAQ